MPRCLRPWCTCWARLTTEHDSLRREHPVTAGSHPGTRWAAALRNNCNIAGQTQAQAVSPLEVDGERVFGRVDVSDRGRAAVRPGLARAR